METSEIFMSGNIFACLYVLGKIGKSNYPSIIDLIVCPLGNFALIIFVVGHTLFRWADTAMKLPIHPESDTEEFSSFVSCCFVVGDGARLLHTYVFSI